MSTEPAAVLDIDERLDGVFNTVVVLREIPPEVLRKHKRDVERLLVTIEGWGPKTVAQVESVRRLLN